MTRLAEIALSSVLTPGLNGRERAVMRHIGDCHTERMGGNALDCSCGHSEVHYNSCRDRHCPLCQGAARARWVRDRMAELLPCPYFHIVFTVAHELLPLVLANRFIFFRVLFACVHETLLAVCANVENLGARVGGLSVLHTWNQKLGFHPHVHCIVPGGGISVDGERWIEGNPNYLVPVKRLSAVFRGKLMQALETMCRGGQFPGDESVLLQALRKAACKPFVVYAKAPFGGPEQVLKYLGRYTHRVGISEKRIVGLDENKVSFSWIHRGASNSFRVMTISRDDFVRKFIQHILPKGLRKIRYFGYMGNRNRGISMSHVRSLILAAFPERAPSLDNPRDEMEDRASEDAVTLLCPDCGRHMRRRPIGVPGSKLGLRARLAVLRRNLHGP